MDIEQIRKILWIAIFIILVICISIIIKEVINYFKNR